MAPATSILQKPPNFQLVADELNRRFGFKRHRQSVAACIRTHFPNLIGQPEPRPKARRRWERSRLGERWQHDASSHQWWPAEDKQTLRLTVADHSRKLMGAVFVPTDTTWPHFEHFRRRFLQHQLPLAVYTDGLSLFGHPSSADDRDPRSEFQRAFSALGVTHLAGPPAHKPKARSNAALAPCKSAWWHAWLTNTSAIMPPPKSCSTGGSNASTPRSAAPRASAPNNAWVKALKEKRTATRPCPPVTLLDLPLALHLNRRVNTDNQIDFLGRSWHIAPTKRSSVTLIPHPQRQFWTVTQPPRPPLNNWPEILGNYSL